MMRSMFAGIAGLRAHQTMMDVVGNNIANVNTAGFKSSQVTFQESLTQLMRGAGDGTNPMQLGLGVKVASIDGVFTQGATQVTGRSTDLSIQGDGFFVMQQGQQRLYSRAGNFSIDGKGNLGANGFGLMGWDVDPATGNLDTSKPIAPITLPLGDVVEPRATSTMEIGANLTADAVAGDTVPTSIVVYDSLGKAHEVAVTFTKTATDNQWDVTATVAGTTGSPTMTPASLTFDGATGKLTAPTPEPDGSILINLAGATPPGANEIQIAINLNGATPLVQFGGDSTADAFKQNGQAIGNLRGFAISDDGTITGQYSNGETKLLGAVATAAFANPSGLVRVGNSMYSTSTNSGDPLVGLPGTSSRGSLTAGALEMSNVDLAQEFTNLIIAQRGFQANSRVITASDELLSDLVNLKR